MEANRLPWLRMDSRTRTVSMYPFAMRPMSSLRTLMLIRSILSVTFIVTLFGCATQPISDAEAKPVPISRILNSKFLTPLSNSGQVTIKRDSGTSGMACSTRIFLDGEPLVDIRTGEKIVIYLPAGEYIVGANPNGICGGGLTEVKATVKAGSKLAFRWGTSGQGSGSIYPTAF